MFYSSMNFVIEKNNEPGRPSNDDMHSRQLGEGLRSTIAQDLFDAGLGRRYRAKYKRNDYGHVYLA